MKEVTIEQKEGKGRLIKKVSQYAFLSEESIVKYCDILKGVDDLYLASCMADVMVSRSANESGIVEEGIKILSDSEKDFQRDYERKILVNQNAIKTGMAIPLAALISRSKEEYHAKGIYQIISTDDIREGSVIYTSSSFVNFAEFEEKANFLSKIATSAKEGTTFEGNLALIKVASLATKKCHIESMQSLFDRNIDFLLLLPAMKLISLTTTEEDCKRIEKYTRSIKVEDIYPYFDQTASLTGALWGKMKETPKVAKKTI